MIATLPFLGRLRGRLPSRRQVALVSVVALLLAGCSMPSMPHVMGMGNYYAITDDATGRVYYTDNLSREARGVIEFEDRASGHRISLEAATVREISQAEFRAGRAP